MMENSNNTVNTEGETQGGSEAQNNNITSEASSFPSNTNNRLLQTPSTSDCPIGSFLNPSSVCATCVSPCRTCINSERQCLDCVAGYIKSGWKCVTSDNIRYNLTLDANKRDISSNMNGFKDSLIAKILP